MGFPLRRLGDAGVRVFDCEHATPRRALVGYVYIAIPDIRDGRLLVDGARRISREDFEKWTRRTRPQAGDVVVTRRGRVGDSAIVPSGLACAIGQNLVILRSDGSQVDQRFLRWALRSPAYHTQVRKYLNVGAVFDSLNVRDFPRFELPIPPLAEQRAIAGVLGALDDKIELNRRMNETLEGMAQLRFASVRPSTLLALGELVTLSRDSVDPGANPDHLYEHFSIPAFDGGQTPAVETGSAIKSGKLAVPSEAVLLSKLNPRIPRVWLPDLRDARRPVCSTEFLVARPTKASSREFLYCLFRSTAFVDDFAGRVAGTSGSHQRVKAADALAIEVLAPDPGDLVELTSSLRPLFERAAANRRESRTLAELRDALLPKLISGELRVRDAEAASEESGTSLLP